MVFRLYWADKNLLPILIIQRLSQALSAGVSIEIERPSYLEEVLWGEGHRCRR